MLWGELNDAAAEHGLAITGGAISTTGIAGLTLGGGLGWLMAKYGLAADNLLAVELVTADGEVARRDRRLRTPTSSGRCAAAAATSASRRRSRTALHPLRMITGGLIAHPIEAGAGDAALLPRRGREAAPTTSPSSPRSCTPRRLGHAARRDGRLPHRRRAEEAERELAPFKEWGSPMVVEVGPMPYPVMNTILDDGLSRQARSTTGSRASRTGCRTS